MNKVSIIMPAYNSEKTIDACVTSITSQTYENLEIIIVNDGSTDATPHLSHQLAASDSRIIVINKDNGGLSDARNAGLAVATGDYMMFVDSDDELGKNAVRSLVDIANANEADIVTFLFTRNINGLDHNYHDGPVNIVGERAVETFFKVDVSACTKIYRREIIKDLRFELGKISEDIIFTFKCFEKCRKICQTEFKFYYYNNFGLSITRSPLKREDKNCLDSYFRIAESCAERYSYCLDAAEIKRSINMFNLINKAAINGYKDGDTKEFYEAVFDDYAVMIRKNIWKILTGGYSDIFNRCQMPIVAVSWRLFIFLKKRLMEMVVGFKHE